ncbi:MAG: hypothetical protein ACXVA2_25110 [Mucilaginibacter sp.]
MLNLVIDAPHKLYLELIMRWFLCIGLVLVANGCANTATTAIKLDEGENLKSKIIIPTSMEQFLHLADVLFPEFKKSCDNGLPSPTTGHYSACLSYSSIIALSYLASERYKDAIKFIKYYKDHSESRTPSNEFCGYDLFFIDQDENNLKFKFNAKVNINSALFIAYDKVNDPQAKDYVISGYLCGVNDGTHHGGSDHEIEIGNTSVAFPGIDRLNIAKSADYFYKDVNKYLGQSADQYSRFYISEIITPITEHDHLITMDKNISLKEKAAKQAILRKNAIDFAKKQKIPQPYIDYMVSDYQMYLSLSR